MKYIREFENYNKLIEAEFREELLDSIRWGKSNFDKLLQVGKNNNYSLDFEIPYEGYYGNPLIIAAERSEYDRGMTKKLIEYGVNVNVKDSENGKTPLIIACENNSLKIIKLLLDNDADLSIQDDDGNDAIDYLQDDDGNDAIDYIQDKYFANIIEDYPEKYKEYLIKKEAEKFNI